MYIRHLFLISLFFIPFSQVSAQYTEVINASRPGVSQGAFSVGRDVLQVETGFSLGREKHRLLNTETNGLGIDYSIRYGMFAEQLEFSIMGEFQANSITHTNIQPSRNNKVANFKRNTIGAKYLFYDPSKKGPQDQPSLYSWRANHKFGWFDLIPAVSIYGGINIDITKNNPFVPNDVADVSPKFVLATQHNWRGGWVFVTNLIVDRIITKTPSFGYIVTLTHATNSHFSLFLENQGINSSFYSDQLLRGGAAALFTPNFQVDLSVTYSFKDTPSILYGRLGLAYRLDFHSENEYVEFIPPERLKKKEKKKKKGKKEKLEQELDVGDRK